MSGLFILRRPSYFSEEKIILSFFRLYLRKSEQAGQGETAKRTNQSSDLKRGKTILLSDCMVAGQLVLFKH